MPNLSVLKRLGLLIDQSDVASCANGSFETSVDWHMEALEGIGLGELHRARDLAYRLCHSYFMEGDELFGDPVDAMKARNAFKSFVHELERRFGAI